MNTFRTAALAVTAGAATLVAPTVAAARAPAVVAYRFDGVLIGEPGAHATHLSIELRGGNAPALRSTVGVDTRGPLTFRLGPRTAFAVATGRAWAPGSAASLHDTDPVAIVVRGRRGLRLRALERRAARAVRDRAALDPAHGALYAFWGVVTGIDTVSHRLSITVLDGNRRALRLMLGSIQQQSFTYDGTTVFEHTTRGIPALVAPTTIAAGQRLSIRIRAGAGAALAAVEATPARIIGVREAPPADG